MANNGNGQVVVTGGSGNNTVSATTTSTKINGGDGNDSITGGSQIDDIRAGNGNDTIFGGAGNDIIFGNDGYDVAKIRDLSTLSVANGQGGTLIATSSDGVDTLKQIEAISDGTNTYVLGQNNGVYGLGKTAATTENNAITFNAFATAFDVEDDAFSIVSATNSGAGAAVGFTAGGSLTYTPGTLFDHLAVGATATDTFSYTVKDAAGKSTTQNVTVTLTGTNDAPTITGGSTSGAVSEDGILSATGSLTATDVDDGATQSWSVQGGGNGSYGALSVNGTGGWNYALANGSGAVQALAAGQSVSDSFTVEVSDGNGGTDSEVVNITIAGANDAPTITGGTTAGTVSEDDVLTATGTLTSADVDSGDSLSWSVQGDGDGAYGSLAIDAAGSWTYTLDNDSTAVQDLNDGDSVTDTFTVQVSDGNGGTDTQAITVTIGGEDDGGLTGNLLVDFEDMNSFFIPQGYKGFNWDSPYGTSGYVSGEVIGVTSQVNQPPGTDWIWSNGGIDPWNITRTDGGDFDFVGTWAATAASVTLRFNGWDDGHIVGTVDIALSGPASYVTANFGSIDRLEIIELDNNTNFALDNMDFFV